MRLLAVLLLLSGSAFAAKPPPAAPAPARGCDLSGTHVAPNFKGSDGIRVIKQLAPAAKKDEFESTSEYEARQVQVVGKVLADGAATKLCYVNTDEGTYDADAGKLWLPLTFSSLVHSPTPWRITHRSYLGERNRKTSSYTATNAFGVSREVGKTKREGYYIAYDADWIAYFVRDMGGKKDLGYFLPVSMPSDQARAKKKGTRLVIQYTVVAPYVTTGLDIDTPTIDSPQDWWSDDSYLLTQITMVAAIDQATGEILYRFNPLIQDK